MRPDATVEQTGGTLGVAARIVQDRGVLSVDGHGASADPHGGAGAATGRERDHAGRADEQVIAVAAAVGQDDGMQQPPLGAEASDDVVD